MPNVPPIAEKPTRRRRRLGLIAAAIAVPAAVGLTPALAATPTTAPGAPTAVTATQAATGPDVRVSWTPPASGSAVTGAAVQLWDVSSAASPNVAATLTCADACTSFDFRAMKPGDRYEALVWSTNAAGTGPAAASPVITVANTCPLAACVGLDATNPIGPANRAAQGLLMSVYPTGNDVADLTQLGATMYRGAPTAVNATTLGWSTWDLAASAGVPTTLVLSDDWIGQNPNTTPWSNWTAYSNWVKSTVKAVLASGHQPTYWEPYNEPGGGAGYNAANFATVTPDLLLQQFLVTYQAIKAVLPSAQIVGPSLAWWTDTPQAPSTSYRAFDLYTFLRYAAANGMKLAAISWHSIADFPGGYPGENTLSPQNLVDEVAQTRSFMATLPALGQPKIFINETEFPEVFGIPGWDVAYLAAITDAHIDSAGLSCWPSTLCTTPTLDGLLASNGTSTMPDYWVRYAYGQMTGQMIATTSTDDGVSAVASYNAASSTVSALIGRNVGCSQNLYCALGWPNALLSALEPVHVQLTVPWTSGSVTVSESHIPGESLLPISGPTSLGSQTLAVTPNGTGTGTVTVTIPLFGDGDVYTLNVTKN